MATNSGRYYQGVITGGEYNPKSDTMSIEVTIVNWDTYKDAPVQLGKRGIILIEEQDNSLPSA